MNNNSIENRNYGERHFKTSAKLAERPKEVELSSKPKSTMEHNNDIMESSNPNEINSCSSFYKKAQEYWSAVPATVNGMLGGLGHISAIDINGSEKFLRNLKIEFHRALDCGAGIGRVSRELLLPRFLKVDMVEQDTKFTEKARASCTEHFPTRIGEIYNIGLQAFSPGADNYDLIWSQWVLGHLTNKDLLEFFRKVKNALHSNAYFVIKENVTSSANTEVDDKDSSVTRPLKDYEHFLAESGLRVVKIERQLHLPKGLFPVYMIASKRID